MFTEPDARGAEVREVEYLAVAVADLARDLERLAVARKRRRVVAAQPRRLAQAVEQVADVAAVAQLAVEAERERLELLGPLELAEHVVGHPQRLQTLGAHAPPLVAQSVHEREGAVGQRHRRARVAEPRA